MFVLDSSASISKENFDLVKSWVQNVGSGFPNDSSFQVGAVVYEEEVCKNFDGTE